MAGNPIFTQFPSVAVAVTPSDSVNLTVDMTIYVGTGGNVTVIPAGTATAVLYKNVPAGGVIPCKVRRINATGTDATDFVGHYNP